MILKINYPPTIQLSIKSLQNWDTSLAGWIAYFNPSYDPGNLASFLKDPIKKSLKLTPSFHFIAGEPATAIRNEWLV